MAVPGHGFNDPEPSDIGLMAAASTHNGRRTEVGLEGAPSRWPDLPKANGFEELVEVKAMTRQRGCGVSSSVDEYNFDYRTFEVWSNVSFKLQLVYHVLV